MSSLYPYQARTKKSMLRA